jgi:hypothetical protein
LPGRATIIIACGPASVYAGLFLLEGEMHILYFIGGMVVVVIGLIIHVKIVERKERK